MPNCTAGVSGAAHDPAALRLPAEGIALLDVAQGWPWRLLYANAALGQLAGRPVSSLPQRFWQLFGMAPGGARQKDVERAVASRQPLTVACVLLPACDGSGGQQSAAAAPTAALLGAPTFQVTLTPADAPDPIDPFEPHIGIPQYSNTRGGFGGDSCWDGGGSSGAKPQYWFAAVHTQQQHEEEASSAASTAGVCSGGSVAAAPSTPRGGRLERLRPACMRGVQLGPLLGCGASGRWGLVGPRWGGGAGLRAGACSACFASTRLHALLPGCRVYRGLWYGTEARLAEQSGAGAVLAGKPSQAHCSRLAHPFRPSALHR